jgi:S-adenosylmethionine:tRNA ribosyltransferase-isomerase
VRPEDFDYELPGDRIAQHPAPRRDDSKLLVLDRHRGDVEHARFRDLATRFRPDDLLVFNDTRVVPCRLIGSKETGGRVELLLLEPVAAPGQGETWRCLLQVARKPAVGSRLRFGDTAQAVVLGRDEEGWTVRFDTAGEDLPALLDRIGRMPLPPYIRRDDSDPDAPDRERYQTVYARDPGAVAAPTAGLHFTKELLSTLSDAGVRTARVTLHVGAGTFLPVRVERVEDHRMHSEKFDLPEETVEAIHATRERGGRVVAVGTTVVRTLEGSAGEDGALRAGRGSCDLFIYPGYRFRVVDAMITNFHLPRSTLLMLVCAFAGRRAVLAAYHEALRAGYRFYSYGDAMLVIGAG